MQVDECFQLGYVIKKHGLKGDLNLLLDVDYPEEYKNLESVFVDINNKLVPFFISKISIKGNRAIATFEDVGTAEKADELRGKGLYLPLDMLPELEENQFYYHEIIGFQVQDAKSGIIGTIENINSSSMQDLLVLNAGGREILIPVNDEILNTVDRKAKILHVNLPDGLLKVYLNED